MQHLVGNSMLKLGQRYRLGRVCKQHPIQWGEVRPHLHQNQSVCPALHLERRRVSPSIYLRQQRHRVPI